MFKYTILNAPSFNINEGIIMNIFKIIDEIVEKKQKGILNIIFVTEYEIRNYNKKYRSIDKVTDVLSFHYFDNFDDLLDDEISGEIIISEKRIVLQGIEFGLGTEKEFYKLIIHSILHIIGYDHKYDNEYKTMKMLEEKIWKIIF